MIKSADIAARLMNIRLSFQDGEYRDAPLKSIHVLDWERATYAPAWVDLGRFMAELWLHEKLHDQAHTDSTTTPTKVQRILSSTFHAYLSRQVGEVVSMQKIMFFMLAYACCYLGREATDIACLEIRRGAAVEALELMDKVATGDLELLDAYNNHAAKIEEHNGTRVTVPHNGRGKGWARSWPFLRLLGTLLNRVSRVKSSLSMSKPMHNYRVCKHLVAGSGGE